MMKVFAKYWDIFKLTNKKYNTLYESSKYKISYLKRFVSKQKKINKLNIKAVCLPAIC